MRYKKRTGKREEGRDDWTTYREDNRKTKVESRERTSRRGKKGAEAKIKETRRKAAGRKVVKESVNFP